MSIKAITDDMIKGGLKDLMGEVRTLVVCSDIPTTAATMLTNSIGIATLGPSNYHRSDLTDGVRLSLVGLPLVDYASATQPTATSRSLVLTNGSMSKFITLSCTEHDFKRGQKIEIDDFHIDLTAVDTSRTLCKDWAWGSYDEIAYGTTEIHVCSAMPTSFSDIALKSLAKADVSNTDITYTGTGNSLQLRIAKKTTNVVTAPGIGRYVAIKSPTAGGVWGTTSLAAEVSVSTGDAFVIDPTIIQIQFKTTAGDIDLRSAA